MRERTGELDGKHGMIVEPFEEGGGGRSGYRVRQDVFGRPAFFAPTAPGSTCLHNPAFNDVVCDNDTGGRSATLVAGDDDDTVFAEERINGQNGQCEANPLPPNLPFFWRWRLDASGGADRDVMTGGGRDDVLRGQEDGDTLTGLGGADGLLGAQGNDALEGGSGNDRLDDGPGDDRARGEDGDDIFVGGAGADDFIGNAGSDTADYAQSPEGVRVTIDGVADDGAAADVSGARRDNVGTLIERVLGSRFDDALISDTGGDTLVGRDGVDSFEGNDGSDTIDARDGIRDSLIRCGNQNDQATLDLADQVLLDARSQCERVEIFAVDDGPPARAQGRRLRQGRRGRVAVRVACPRAARTACRGVLTLRRRRSDRVLARGRYRLRLGRKASVAVTVRRGLPRQVLAHTRERGVSSKGPRSARVLLRTGR